MLQYLQKVNPMASILIKDTTREQREQIVRESLGDDYDVGCGFEVALL